MSKIFITDYIENPFVEQDILKDLLSDKFHENIEIVLVWHKAINEAYISQLPNLKAIIRYGVGYDNIDLNAAKAKNVYVCNTPDYGTEEVSDTAIAMILNISRGLTRYDYQCRFYQNNWQENIIHSIKRNSEQIIGVIGAGRIGGSILLKAKYLRFQTVFYDPYIERGYEKLLDAKRVETVDELLAMSDIVSFNAPLTDETNKTVNKQFISKMKEGSSFINTARGGVVSDIDIFYDALKSNYLSNVSTDVLPHEPPGKSKLIDAWRNREEWLDGRFVLTPHTAYYSNKAYCEMREKAALNALRVLNGQKPYNIVNDI